MRVMKVPASQRAHLDSGRDPIHDRGRVLLQPHVLDGKARCH